MSRSKRCTHEAQVSWTVSYADQHEREQNTVRVNACADCFVRFLSNTKRPNDTRHIVIVGDLGDGVLVKSHTRLHAPPTLPAKALGALLAMLSRHEGHNDDDV